MKEMDISGIGTKGEIYIEPEESFHDIPGATVDIEIIKDKRDDVLCIYLDCIAEDGFVYVVNEQGIAEKREIKTGFKDDFSIEVVSGLNIDDTVIVNPGEMDLEGKTVTIID